MSADELHRFEIWEIQMIRGILLLVLGVIALLLPVATLLSSALLVAVAALVEGITLLFATGSSGRSRMADLALGGMALVVGMLVLIAPIFATAALSTVALLALSIWCVFMGAQVLRTNRRTVHPLIGRTVTYLWGAMMLLVGVAIPIILLAVPGSFNALAWIFAIAAVFVGLSLLWQALTLRQATRQVEGQSIPNKSRRLA